MFLFVVTVIVIYLCESNSTILLNVRRLLNVPTFEIDVYNLYNTFRSKIKMKILLA